VIRTLDIDLREHATGSFSRLLGMWSSYLTIDEAREAAREMLRAGRVLLVTVVEDDQPRASRNGSTDDE
jgi:hypothetical protein